MRAERPLLVLLFPVVLAAGSCDEDTPKGDAIQVPSGRDLSLIEVITNAPGNAGAAARFRFLAPGLQAGDPAAPDDMQALCDSYALPRIDGMVPAPQEIIISFSAAPVPFGEAAPDVLQFFESYRVENGQCLWEPF
jgi:hypothetical protein